MPQPIQRTLIHEIEYTNFIYFPSIHFIIIISKTPLTIRLFYVNTDKSLLNFQIKYSIIAGVLSLL